MCCWVDDSPAESGFFIEANHRKGMLHQGINMEKRNLCFAPLALVATLSVSIAQEPTAYVPPL